MLTAQCSYHLNCHVTDMTLSLQCYSQQVNILWLTRKATMQWVIFQPFCTIALCIVLRIFCDFHFVGMCVFDNVIKPTCTNDPLT